MQFPAKWIQSNGNLIPQVRIPMLVAAYSLLAVYLYWHGQPLVSPSGVVKLWEGDPYSSEVSRQVADWYSLSHFLHGVLIVFMFRIFLPKIPIRYAFLTGIVTAVSWEVIEHTNFVLDKFRADTVSFGYTGDSILNSVSDATIMSIGLYTATRLKIKHIIAVFVAFELIALVYMRDNLTLSTLMLLYPVPAIKAWQLEPLASRQEAGEQTPAITRE